ncbi:hypothetical protein OROMI_001286 [Orobanche minor]
MDEKGKYMLSLGSGGLLGSAATLATSKLLLRVEGNVLMWTSLTPTLFCRHKVRCQGNGGIPKD